MIAKLPLVPFAIINLTRLTAGVCMKVRFKSKVTRDFSPLAASRLSRGSRKTSGTRVISTPLCAQNVLELRNHFGLRLA